ncbi:hypothetical protein ACIPVB_02530 [Microbacterium sp. NPDC090007]|uniref:hypothetical protein n=1 Tax=Microbacterium sp. NPDC090007 TaxID=3364204 RepID=UPI00382FE5AA
MASNVQSGAEVDPAKAREALTEFEATVQSADEDVRERMESVADTGRTLTSLLTTAVDDRTGAYMAELQESAAKFIEASSELGAYCGQLTG